MLQLGQELGHFGTQAGLLHSGCCCHGAKLPSHRRDRQSLCAARASSESGLERARRPPAGRTVPVYLRKRKKEQGITTSLTGGTRQRAGQGCAGVAAARLKTEGASDGFQKSSMAQLTEAPLGMFVSESACCGHLPGRKGDKGEAGQTVGTSRLGSNTCGQPNPAAQ